MAAPAASRPAPAGPLLTVRRSLSTPLDAAVTLIVVAVVVAAAVPLARWALLDAVWTGTATDCRAAGGACWAFVGHKLGFILFGLYPPSERWRAALALGLLASLIVVTALPRFWRRETLVGWAVALALAFWLMHGGLGLTSVPTRLWGGLPITLMLTALGLASAFPFAVLLALGRRSRLPVPRALATTFVETVRGIPLIAVLYVAALVVPLALPPGVGLDKLFLAQCAVAVFASAYLAEAVRAGLQIVPRGQYEAARALGLRPWQVQHLVILPQALRVVVPSFVSIAVGFFQDTSLVVIIALFDLLNTARFAAQDPQWLGFYTEAYVFVGLIYFAGSTLMSQYGLWLERHLRRDPHGFRHRAPV
jgi:general L-amino acid transport system permease protein